jgi:hypothetical protein
MNGQKMKVLLDLDYPGVTLERTRSWNKQKTAKTEGYQALVVVG